ncbi:hypothetical protein Ae201684P_019303 [Aphanomyces euteiches]|nr:hypothetical protein Ae201684P_019303 [Aphanomyces euteiches]
MDAYLKANGIRKQTTQPHTSASNGEAENAIRTMANDARTFMMACDIPKSLWGYAFRHATYIRNRVPCIGNNDWESPLFKLTGKHPKVSHILPFGSNCTVHQAPQDKSITRRADLGIILGVNDEIKGYDVYLPQQNKVIATRDVRNITAPTPRRDVAEFLVGTSLPNASRLTNETNKSLSGKDNNLPKDHKKAKTVSKPDLTIRTRSQRAKEATAEIGACLNAQVAAYLAADKTLAKQWRDSMVKELEGVVGNGVLEIVLRPPATNVVDHKWVYKVVYDQKGNIDKFKSRLVARGFTQRYGVDYSKTFASVIKQASVRLLFVLAAKYNCSVRHMDFPQAYLQAKSDHDIYFELPKELGVDTQKYVGKLIKSIYGLKQSGMLWNEEINGALLKFGFSRSKLDPCIYFLWNDKGLTLCGLYVDDLLIFSQDDNVMRSLTEELTCKYKIKDLGEVKRCLGMNVHSVEGGFFLEQSNTIQELLVRHGMAQVKSQPTPIGVGHGFYDEGDESEMSQTELREIVGSFLWLAGSTRPDISVAVNMLARHVSNHNVNHERGAKRILRYLAGTMDVGLLLIPNTEKDIKSDIFCDADWAGNKTNRRSTSGCLMTVNGSSVAWYSKQQAVVALSTMEAEYIASSVGVQECLWIDQLMVELKLKNVAPTQLWNDNQSALKTMENDMAKSRAKHIDIRFHFIRDAVKSNKVRTGYCETGKMPADILTKPLSTELHMRRWPCTTAWTSARRPFGPIRSHPPG